MARTRQCTFCNEAYDWIPFEYSFSGSFCTPECAAAVASRDQLLFLEVLTQSGRKVVAAPNHIVRATKQWRSREGWLPSRRSGLSQKDKLIAEKERYGPRPRLKE